MVEGIAVCVLGGLAERGDPSVFPDVAVLNIAGHIAEDEVLPLARPSRAFRPIGAGPYAANRRVPQSHGVEFGIDDDDVRVGIDRRAARCPVARRARDRAGRVAQLRIWCGLRLRLGPARSQRGGADSPGAGQQTAARQWMARAHAAPPMISAVRRRLCLMVDRKGTRLNSSPIPLLRMPS